MTKTPSNKGLAIHCHHDTLVEYCYDYRERVKYIKEDKPESEQELRLKLFKLLPKEAEKDIPKYYLGVSYKVIEIYLKWEEAYYKWEEVNRKWQNETHGKEAEARRKKDEAYSNQIKLHREWGYYRREQGKAYNKWLQTEKDAFHAKWCGCKEWNGEELTCYNQKA